MKLAPLVAGLIVACIASRAPAEPAAAFLTGAQLEKLPFNSVADPAFVEDALVFPDTRTAIFFPRKEFDQGAPIRAWLIVKSLNRQRGRPLATGFDLGAPGKKAHVEGSARLQICRLTAGPGAAAKTPPPGEILADIKGQTGPEDVRMLVPAGGYLVNEGDLRNLLPARRLGPGTYRLRFWAEGQRAEATFTVSERAIAAPASAPGLAELFDPGAHEAGVLYWINALQGRPQQRQGQMRWPLRGGYLSPRALDDFEIGLAMGVGTGPLARYYARVTDIPARDDVVAISTTYIRSTPDKLRIVLTPASMADDAPGGARGDPTTAPAAPRRAPPRAAIAYQLPSNPYFYLLVENMDKPIHLRLSSERQGAMPSNTMPFNAPIYIDAQLPEEWASRLAFKGKARLTVIVSAEPILPGVEQPGEQIDSNNFAPPVVPRFPGRRWTGIVRSAPMDISLGSGGAPAGR